MQHQNCVMNIHQHMNNHGCLICLLRRDFFWGDFFDVLICQKLSPKPTKLDVFFGKEMKRYNKLQMIKTSNDDNKRIGIHTGNFQTCAQMPEFAVVLACVFELFGFL